MAVDSFEDVLSALEGIGLAGPGLSVPYFSDEPKYPSCFFPTPSAGPYLNWGPYGLSLARSPEVARLKALAEFYERLCLHNVTADCEPAAPRAERDFDPVRFAAAEVRADPAKSNRLRSGYYRRLEATRVPSGEAVRVPAQVVLPNFDRADEPVIIAKIGSSGCALGRRGDGGAWTRGLFEVIERSASIRFRIEAAKAPRIAGLPPNAADILAAMRRYRLEPTVFVVENPFAVPCVAAVLTDSSGAGPAFSMARRAAPTWERAVEEALLESLERRRPARLERARGEPTQPVYPWPTIERLRDVLPAIERAPVVSYSEELDPAEVSAAEILKRLTSRGFDVLQVDLTLPEVANAGFEALKVLVPDLGPLPA